MKNLAKWSIFSIGIFLTSCNIGKEESSDMLSFISEQFSNSEEFYLRGISLEDSRKKVIELEEDSSLISATEFELVYQYRFPDAQAFTVRYFFDKQFVHEIEINIFLKSIEKADKITPEIVKILSQKFGTYVIESGYYVWKYPVNDYLNGYLSLIDESEEYQYGKINILNYVDFGF